MNIYNQESPLLWPKEVALLLRVDVKTLTRWARIGRLSCVTLPSGHRRYRRSDIEAFFKDQGMDLDISGALAPRRPL